MRVKLLEKLWRHTVPQQIVGHLNDAINDGNHEHIKQFAVEILEMCKSFFDVEEDDYVLYEIDEIIESFNDLDDSSGDEDFDLVLGSFYDFMDGYSIALGGPEKNLPETKDGGLGEVLVEPKKGEKEQEYVSRFMGSKQANKDFPNQKQRVAVGYSKFRAKKAKKEGSELKEGEQLNEMVIDLILDRKDGFKYSPEGFYRDAMEYGEISDEITRAMDAGTEEDVKKALCDYVIANGYNQDICDYINSVTWLEADLEEAITPETFTETQFFPGEDGDNEALIIADSKGLVDFDLEYSESKKGWTLTWKISADSKDELEEDMNNITLKQFNAYRAVQFGGRFNMMSPQARIMTGLPRDIYLEILQNYEALEKKYGDYSFDKNAVDTMEEAKKPSEKEEKKELKYLLSLEKVSPLSKEDMYRLQKLIQKHGKPDEDLGLPNSIEYDIEELDVSDEDVKNEDILSDIISDRLSDDYGFTHFGFNFNVKRDKQGLPKSVVVTDIEWDIEESLKLKEAKKTLGR